MNIERLTLTMSISFHENISECKMPSDTIKSQCLPEFLSNCLAEGYQDFQTSHFDKFCKACRGLKQ